MGYFCPTRVTLVLRTNTLPTSNNYVAQNYNESIAFNSDKKIGIQVEGGWEFDEPKLPQHFIQLTIHIFQRLNLGAKPQFTPCLKHSISYTNITLQSTPCDCASARNCDAQRNQAPLSAQPHTNWPKQMPLQPYPLNLTASLKWWGLGNEWLPKRNHEGRNCISSINFFFF